MDASASLPYTAATVIIDEGFSMTKAISVALIVGGIVLLYFGGQSFHSFSNDVSRVFTGAPTNKTIFLLVGGVIATLAGLTGLALSGKR
jgi:drug/metabolite transporter (DMT)-like permease